MDKVDESAAVLALTENGKGVACKIYRNFSGAVLYLPQRFQDKENYPGHENNAYYFSNWQETVKMIFDRYDYIIFVCAAGIAVRSVAPLLKDKNEDPAVVVVDDKGKHAISLLSGHRGGGNYLAKELAAILEARAVITTATDLEGWRMPPDLLAFHLEAHAEPAELVKEFNRRAAEGEKINIYSPFNLAKEIKTEYSWQGWPDEDSKGDFQAPAVVVSPYVVKARVDEDEFLYLKPRCLVVGLGCRRGVSGELISEAVKSVLAEYGLDEKCIKALATIEYKATETGIHEYKKEIDVPLLTCNKKVIQELEGSFQGSSRVRSELGVDGVCEPAAKVVSGGKILVPKQKRRKVTVSIALAKSWWWD